MPSRIVPSLGSAWTSPRVGTTWLTAWHPQGLVAPWRKIARPLKKIPCGFLLKVTRWCQRCWLAVHCWLPRVLLPGIEDGLLAQTLGINRAGFMTVSSTESCCSSGKHLGTIPRVIEGCTGTVSGNVRCRGTFVVDAKTLSVRVRMLFSRWKSLEVQVFSR